MKLRFGEVLLPPVRTVWGPLHLDALSGFSDETTPLIEQKQDCIKNCWFLTPQWVL